MILSNDRFHLERIDFQFTRFDVKRRCDPGKKISLAQFPPCGSSGLAACSVLGRRDEYKKKGAYTEIWRVQDGSDAFLERFTAPKTGWPRIRGEWRTGAAAEQRVATRRAMTAKQTHRT